MCKSLTSSLSKVQSARKFLEGYGVFISSLTKVQSARKFLEGYGVLISSLSKVQSARKFLIKGAKCSQVP